MMTPSNHHPKPQSSSEPRADRTLADVSEGPPGEESDSLNQHAITRAAHPDEKLSCHLTPPVSTMRSNHHASSPAALGGATQTALAARGANHLLRTA